MSKQEQEKGKVAAGKKVSSGTTLKQQFQAMDKDQKGDLIELIKQKEAKQAKAQKAGKKGKVDEDEEEKEKEPMPQTSQKKKQKESQWRNYFHLLGWLNHDFLFLLFLIKYYQ